MRRSGKRHKGKEMSVSECNRKLQIPCPERDSGDEEREKIER
jgi:hypothetical protein